MAEGAGEVGEPAGCGGGLPPKMEWKQRSDRHQGVFKTTIFFSPVAAVWEEIAGGPGCEWRDSREGCDSIWMRRSGGGTGVQQGGREK